MQQAVIDLYQQKFHDDPRFLIRSPGRVNLIGDHTDYNDGFALPLAINYALWMAIAPIDEDRIELYSGDFDQKLVFGFDSLEKEGEHWAEYIKGVAYFLQKNGFQLRGFRGVILSNLPIGAGLSSSAAIEMAVVKALAEVSGFSLDVKQMALIGQQVENEWIGINSGIMDQLISAGGVKDHAVFIDCRSLEHKPIRIPETAMIAVLDTTTRRELSNSGYNERRQQCESASRVLKVSSLRNLTREHFAAHRSQMEPVLANRVLHILSENERTCSIMDKLQQADLAGVGELLIESHRSLRDLYEISTPALNRMSEAAVKSRGCFGARMTGGGFGGCAVALIDALKADIFVDDVKRNYHNSSGLDAKIYLTKAEAGTEIIPVSSLP